MDKIKYVHLQIEKDVEKIVYTIFDECGALATFRTRTELDNYLWRQNEIYKNNLKIVDIIHINYNLQGKLKMRKKEKIIINYIQKYGFISPDFQDIELNNYEILNICENLKAKNILKQRNCYGLAYELNNNINIEGRTKNEQNNFKNI